MKNYVVMDLENPNLRCNSVCSIAVIIVKDNKIIDKKYTLINPEDRFDSKNSEVNGITSSMVENSPTIKDYWQEIREILTNNVIVGHNITYDLSVLSKSLNRYGIEVPNFSYCCTLELSKKYLKLDSYKLSEIANYLNIKYNPHNALEDSETAYKLFEYLKQQFKSETFQIKSYKFEFILKENIDSKLSTNINNLFGIIKGINYDGIINQLEIELLNKWVEENLIYKQYTLFNNIIIDLTSILEDGIITEYERLKLMNLVDSINHSKIYNETTLSLQILQGIINGISCDEKIVLEEMQSLKIWLEKNDYLSGVYPYDKVTIIVNRVLEDGIITESEKQELAETFKELMNPTSNNNGGLELKDKTFCLSGEFKNGSKSEIKEKLEKQGATEKSGVSSKVDYLFVGGLGSDAWKYGNVGGKIAKAQELQEQGNQIKIVSEEDLFNEIKEIVEV